MKTALVFGATGLTGKKLLNELIKNNLFDEIHVFVRKQTLFNHPKIKIHSIDFRALENSTSLIKGDVVFCCLGTTISKAGSEEAFRKIDFELPVKIAEIASENGVSKFIVISSLGANKESSNFYLRTKGEMEEAVKKFSFAQISILRPSMLLGSREEFRFGELIGKGFIRLLSPLMLGNLKKYKGIYAETVAKAMVKLAVEKTDKIIFESDELQKLGKYPPQRNA